MIEAFALFLFKKIKWVDVKNDTRNKIIKKKLKNSKSGEKCNFIPNEPINAEL